MNLSRKFQKLKGDPKYCAAFMLIIFLWFLWDRSHNPLYSNLELFLSVEASLGTFLLAQNIGKKTRHQIAVEKNLKTINDKLDILLMGEQ